MNTPIAPRVKRKSAFTLVELLVVIGIIALLISILLPSLNKARQSALAVQCLSNLRQGGIAIRMYADQNHGFIPAGYAHQRNDAGTTVATYWPERIAKAIVDNGEFRRFGFDMLRCPAREPQVIHTYGMNYGGRGDARGPWYFVVGSSPQRNLGYKLSRCKNSWFLLSDAWGIEALTLTAGQILTPSPSYGWPLNADYDQDGVLDTYVPMVASYGPHNGVATVHGKRLANFLFADGSAAPRSIVQWATNDNEMWMP